MKILITNDDGIKADGIKKLAKTFAESGNLVSVVAPERERSAAGHAITVHKPLRVSQVDSEGISYYAVSGTPADCVKLALEKLIEKPDIVISGINRGANLGTDVLYSGTVSAAIEAALNGLPAIAVSIVSCQYPTYEAASALTLKLAKIYLEKGLPKGTLLNVNVPNQPANEIKGIKISKLGERKYINNFEKRTDPRGRVYYWMAGEVDDSNPEQGTDVWAVVNQFVSVTPIHFDLTNHYFLSELSKWEL
ncbi:MAG: 5'/3'-nucleotidase SurE [Clostridia bacterium]|nr:5'/3'-nucleotidase SurE [Clostridia bacterium]